MSTYRIDLDRLNRHKVITYFHFVNFNNGYPHLVHNTIHGSKVERLCIAAH